MENKYIFEPKMGSHKLEEIAFVLTNVLTENQKPLKINDLKGFFCGTSRNRTRDTRIFSPLLYRLS